MKNIFVLVLLTSVVSLSLAVASPGQQRYSSSGYLKMDSKKRTFFVKKPFALERGFEVHFSSKKAERLACKLEAKSRYVSCPLQTISFEIKGNRSQQLINARVERPYAAWNRLAILNEFTRKP